MATPPLPTMDPGQTGVRSYCPRMGKGNSQLGTRWVVVALAAAALLGGCADSEDAADDGADAANVLQAGAPGEPSRELSEEEAAKIERRRTRRRTSTSCAA